MADGSLAQKSSEPFLTAEQRSALDTALAAKSKEKSLHSFVKDSQSAARDGRDSLHAGRGGKDGDRKSRMGKGSGRAKKGGAGGKYVWGGLMDDEAVDGVIAMDHNDPNYDSSDEMVIFDSASAVNLSNFKNAVLGIVDEYFNSGDIPEASRCLTDLYMPQYSHWFVKHIVRVAMGRKDREREMTSVLLSSAYGSALSSEQVVKGFENLLEWLDDLILDIPNAPQLLALFISRSIVDDILPPSFVGTISTDDELHTGVRRTCEGHLSARHAAERLLRCWGSGAGLMLDETKASMKNLLIEFKESKDVSEARKCLIGLGVPFYHHELVKQAIHLGMEDVPNQEPMLDLLAKLAASGDINQTQMSKGFVRVLDSLDDTELDYPNARQALAEMMAEGRKNGWLDNSLKEVPTTSSETSNSIGTQHVPAFKNKAGMVLREYFNSYDVNEVRHSLDELQEPGLMNLLVKKAVTMAFDGKHKDREAVSVLLGQLYPATIKEDQMALGFTKLLASAEDLTLDVPEVRQQLAVAALPFLFSAVSSTGVGHACPGLEGFPYAQPVPRACHRGRFPPSKLSDCGAASPGRQLNGGVHCPGNRKHAGRPARC